MDLNGGFSPYQAPILYVAGKLTLSSLNIGRAKLAVLPGGEVKIGTLKIQPSAADGAAVYVFADGKLSVGKPNVSGKCIVNNGTLTVDGSLDMNSGLTVYNTATGVLTVTDEMKVSNSARIYNDGAVTVDDLKINSDGEFHNCENALLVVNDECELERSTAIYQRGRASIEEMTARGTIWVNCHTSVNELEAQGAEFNFSANAGLDAGRVEFNNTNVSMARGAIFTMEEYNADVQSKLRTLVDNAMRKLVKLTKATAPRDTGEYVKHIASKTTSDTPTNYAKTWYVRGERAYLTHLLNFGHAKVNGGRVEGTHFLDFAKKQVVEEYLDAVKEALSGG